MRKATSETTPERRAIISMGRSPMGGGERRRENGFPSSGGVPEGRGGVAVGSSSRQWQYILPLPTATAD
jgi:hypothetical protein